MVSIFMIGNAKTINTKGAVAPEFRFAQHLSEAALARRGIFAFIDLNYRGAHLLTHQRKSLYGSKLFVLLTQLGQP